MSNSDRILWLLRLLKTIIAKLRKILIGQSLLKELTSLVFNLFHYKFLVGIIILLIVAHMSGKIMGR